MNRRLIVKRALRARRAAGASIEEQSLAGLARRLHVSRQFLYAVLALEERSERVEKELSAEFPELPPWPHPWDGAMTAREWLKVSGT